MLIRSEILRLKLLHTAKGRKSANTVLIEGLRLVEDCLLSQWPIKSLFITEDNMSRPKYIKVVNLAKSVAIKRVLVSKNDMERISNTKNPQGIAMEIYIPLKNKNISLENKVLYLDKISDPGNLGTIMRTAAWFGVEQILLSKNCTDIWNSKVLRSAMGAHFKIICDVLNLDELLSENLDISHKVYGSYIDGGPLKDLKAFNDKWILILGNEAHGISEYLEKYIDKKIRIEGSGYQESLNVAVAGGIILKHLNREYLS